MTLTIFEGLDRTGKTEGSELLKQAIERQEGTGRVELIHKSAPEYSDGLEEYVRPLLEYEPGEEHIICDRWHLGELVWPEHFGRESILTDEQRFYVELFLQSRGALVVLTRRARHEIEKAFRDADPPEPLPVEQVGPALLDFQDAFNGVLTLRGEYDHAHSTENLQRVLSAALLGEKACRPGVQIHREWIGSPRPELLVLTDHDPAFQGFPLLDDIDGWGDQPLAVAAVDAHDQLRDLWCFLGQPEVAVTTEGTREVALEQGVQPKREMFR